MRWAADGLRWRGDTLSREDERHPLEEATDPASPRIVKRRHLRLRMLAGAAASYAVDAAILLLYSLQGTTELRVPLLYALAGGLVCATFFVLFRNDVGIRSDDPFLSTWQMAPSVALQLVFLAVAPEVGIVFLTALFIVVSIGTMRLSVAQTGGYLLLASAGVIAVLHIAGVGTMIPVRTMAERWITGLCLSLALGRCAVTVLLTSLYRQLLARRTTELRSLTTSLEEQVADRTRELAVANRELEGLLAKRTAEIENLHGVLPICSHCKKIRDDKGAWSEFEAYISAHTAALFTHGLCADCLAKHYADYS